MFFELLNLIGGYISLGVSSACCCLSEFCSLTKKKKHLQGGALFVVFLDQPFPSPSFVEGVLSGAGNRYENQTPHQVFWPKKKRSSTIQLWYFPKP